MVLARILIPMVGAISGLLGLLVGWGIAFVFLG